MRFALQVVEMLRHGFLVMAIRVSEAFKRQASRAILQRLRLIINSYINPLPPYD